jgi:hypothetical protein
MSLELPLFRDSDTGINNMQEIWEKKELLAMYKE